MDTMIEVQEQTGRENAWVALRGYFRHPAILLATVALTTAVLYSGTLIFEFVWDDKPQIVDNPLIRSFDKVHKVFFSDLWYHTGRFQLYYRPLFVIWSMLNYKVAGLHAWGWHAGAILLHVLATLSVFWLVRKMGGEYWTAALTSLIFGLHPIHIECVAWISAASDSMATLFAVLAFGAFVKARQSGVRHPIACYGCSLVSLACALLTKEIALCFCVLVGVYVCLFPSKNRTRLWQRLGSGVVAAVPYGLITVGYLILRKYAFTEVTGKFDPHHGLLDVLLTLPYVLAFYLRQMLLPVGLTGLYYVPYVSHHDLARIVSPIVLLVGLSVVLVWWARKTRDLLVIFAALWTLLGLAPALYLRCFGNGDFVRDRYIYLGSVGFALLLAKSISLLPAVGKWNVAMVRGATVAVLCLGYISISILQQPYWSSDLLIYSRAYQLYPQNPYTAIGLAREYERLGLYERAIPLVQSAYREDPAYLYTMYALADVYIAAGRKDEARVALLRAEKYMPEYRDSETGAAATAGMWGKIGDTGRALELCSKVLSEDPELFSGLFNCGNIHLMAGDYAEAERLLTHAMQVASELAGPRHFLGRALYLDGKNDQALPYLRQAVAMDPTVYDFHLWLGMSLEKSGDIDGARTEYRRALELNSGSAEARNHLASLEGM
ncbi:MAG TPA: tetratricopeptide repeat protein [Terriglobales bacterium]|nr:tetratricopeptide repeat protein [Terriglobales bacterium]